MSQTGKSTSSYLHSLTQSATCLSGQITNQNFHSNPTLILLKKKKKHDVRVWMKISLENSSRTHVLAEDGHSVVMVSAPTAAPQTTTDWPKYSSQVSEDACSQLLRLWSRPPPASAPPAASESPVNKQVIFHSFMHWRSALMSLTRTFYSL